MMERWQATREERNDTGRRLDMASPLAVQWTVISGGPRGAAVQMTEVDDLMRRRKVAFTI